MKGVIRSVIQFFSFHKYTFAMTALIWAVLFHTGSCGSHREIPVKYTPPTEQSMPMRLVSDFDYVGDTVIRSVDTKSIKQAVLPAVQQAITPVLGAVKENNGLLKDQQQKTNDFSHLMSQMQIVVDSTSKTNMTVAALVTAFNQEHHEKLQYKSALADEKADRSKEKGDMLTEIRGLRAELKGGQYQHDGTNISFFQVAIGLCIASFIFWFARLSLSLVTRKYFPEFYQHFKPDYL